MSAFHRFSKSGCIALGVLALTLPSGCYEGGVEKPEDTGPYYDPGDENPLDTGETDLPTDSFNPEDTSRPQDSADSGLPEPVDNDGDGYYSDEDCDDDNPDINPGAEELDDRIDNDCNGLVDDAYVCDGIDAEYTTIQQALNEVPAGWTLVVCPGTWEENIVFPNKAVRVLAEEGPGETTLEPADSGTPLRVVGVDWAAFEGFTITGADGETGGGVYCQNSTLELIGNVFTDNYATNGGGLAANDCTLALTDNTFSDNEADDYGGGAYLYACSGDVSGNEFYNNLSSNGGALTTYGGNTPIIENLFEDNYTYSFGGAIYHYSDARIEGNEFNGNVTDDDGGALYVVYGSGDISDNTFSENACGDDGGAIYLNQSTSTFSGNVLTDNVAYDDGGGLRVYVSATTIEDNEFYNNQATDDGGGAKLSHWESTVSNNYFEGNEAGDAGGGMELDNDTSLITDNTFVANIADRGAGLHSWRNESPFTIQDSVFYENEAGDCGGAISLDNDIYTVNLERLEIFDNTAEDGGGICADWVEYDSNDDDIVDTWKRNKLSIKNTVIYDNEANDDGGALYMKVATAELENFVMHGNAGPGDGSAIAIKAVDTDDDDEYDEFCTVTITNGIIDSHSEIEAIYVKEATVTISYTDFYDNDAGNTHNIDDPVGSDGNISADPEYVDPDNGDFSLEASSACIDAGSPSIHDSDGTRSDMGAYGGPDGDW